MGDFGIPVATDDSLADKPNPETTNFTRFITDNLAGIRRIVSFLFQCVGNIFNEIRRIWAGHYPRAAAFVEPGAQISPPPVICFIIIMLLALTQIKAQALPGFPFVMHQHFKATSITSVLVYAFISAFEEVIIPFAGYDRNSFCAVAAGFEDKTLGICEVETQLSRHISAILCPLIPIAIAYWLGARCGQDQSTFVKQSHELEGSACNCIPWKLLRSTNSISAV